MKGSLFINPILYTLGPWEEGAVLFVRRARKAAQHRGWFQPVKHYDNTPLAIRYIADGAMMSYPLTFMEERLTPCS